MKSVASIGAALIAAFAFGALSVWLYREAAQFDADSEPVTLKSRVMERKSHALEGLVSAVAQGDLRRVAPMLTGLERSMLAIDTYLETDMYARHGSAYRAAIEQLREAVETDDWLMAKDATLAIERACLDCHQLLLGR